MKTTRQFTSKQIAAAALALALLAAISIIPWRLVAQERPAAVPQDPRQPAASGTPVQTAGETAPGSAGGQTASERGAKEQAAQEKLIIGTWRGKDLSTGDSSEWVFQKDGTYQVLFVRGQNPQPFGGWSGGPNYFRELGKWRIVDGMLAVTPNREPSMLRGLVKLESATPGDIPAAGAVPGETTVPDPEGHFKIIRLDDSLLRLQQVTRTQLPGPADWVSMGGVTFSHRVDPKEAPTDFDPSLPARLREIAALARLTPKDASKIARTFADKDPQGEPLHWELVGQIVSAKNGKTDFAELFGLQPGEAAAYNELLKLVGSYRTAWNLANDGQLAAKERSALDKLASLQSELNAIRGAVGNTIADLQSEFGATPFGATPFGPAESEASPKSLAAKEEFVAEMKLKLFLDALAGYLNSTVYDNENLLGGPPPGGPMGGMMMGAGGSNHAAGPDFRPAATTNDPPPGASPAADQLR